MSNKNNVKNSTNEYEIEKLKLLLEHCTKDAEGQDIRKSNVDTKSSYLLVLVVFLLGILLQEFEISNVFVKEFFSKNIFEILYRIMLILLYISDIVLSVISIFLYVVILINKKYIKINSNIFNIDNIEEVKYIEVIKGLIRNYNNIAKENSEVNNKVMKKYKTATILLLISLVITVVIYLMNIIIKVV